MVVYSGCYKVDLTSDMKLKIYVAPAAGPVEPGTPGGE